jgi:ribonuclease R
MQRLYTGTINLTSKKDGYVRVPDLQKEGSIYVDHSHLQTALQGDLVEVELLGKKKNPKGEDELYGSITKVIERGKKGYAGVIEEENGIFFLIPDDKKMYTDILLKPESMKEAKVGMKVIANITKWEDPQKSPLGEVTMVLGYPGDNDAEMLAYALERGFSQEHNVEVVKEAEDIKARGILEEERQKGFPRSSYIYH